MPSVLDTLAAHSDNPSSFLALNSGNEYFHDERFEGTCAYRTSGRYVLQFGGPFTAPEHRERLLDAFAAHAGRRLVAVQLQRADAELYAARGFTVNQIGASYAVDLSRFTLRGSRFVRLRNKISRARRAGLEVTEVRDGDDCAELDRLDRRWLREKGRHVKELRFLVGQRDGSLQVTPYTSCALEPAEGHHVNNIVLQDIEPDDRTPHVSMPYNPTVLNEVLRALAS
ncbi:phosphatidylglycerol lysyltransferase domain-containing protein [Streptomyces sp. SCL15-6]|uniref:phosphatidylglycerol lysyltransferase domain-containing protein n=1 Tax=Streptomyces sp. SCL15-6 TaxID=2967222 RepID=UPI00398FE866